MPDKPSKIHNKIRDVAMMLSDPHDADEIARTINVAPPIAKTHLQNLVAADELVVIRQDGESLYYPDPLTKYFARLKELLEPRKRSALADDWDDLRETIAAWRERSAIGSLTELKEYEFGTRLVASSRVPVGFHPYDADWDVLVILDTCRIDALRAVAGRIDELEPTEVTPRLSRGSNTAEWLCQTFTRKRLDEIARTGYVAGNGYVKGIFQDGLRPDNDFWYEGLTLPTAWEVVEGDAFGALVNAWKRDQFEYSTDVPWAPHPSPRTVTDHAIALSRERTDLERLIVHYKQPHFPYTISARTDGRTELAKFELSPFEFLASGGQFETVWNAYLTDLRAAIDEVCALRRNVDGEIALMADHGEAFKGKRTYGHRPTILHPMVRRVPWATVSATDERTREGDLSTYSTADRDVEEHLEALGYR
jgi:hypothetical protein